MSINATKSVTTISRLLNQDKINEQQRNQTTAAPARNNSNIGTNVSLSQNTMALLQTTENDINIEKIEQIKQAITDGTLEINCHKIADELIKQMIQEIKS